MKSRTPLVSFFSKCPENTTLFLVNGSIPPISLSGAKGVLRRIFRRLCTFGLIGSGRSKSIELGIQKNIYSANHSKTKKKISDRKKSRRQITCELLEERALLAVLTWDGGGGDNNWTTSANWVGDIAPVAGDDLVFDGAIRTNAVNNFAAGTSFKSLTFASGNFTLSGNRINLTDAISVNSGISNSLISLYLTPSATISVDVVDTSLSVSGVISGSYGLTKTGDGNLVLTGANTYTASTTIQDGSIELAGSGELADGAIVNNSVFIVNRSGYGLSNDISGTGTLVKRGSASLVLSGGNTYTGGTVIESGMLKVGNVVGTGTLGTGSIVNDGTLHFSRSGTTTISDTISGSGALIQSLGTLILNADNTYSGTTYVSSLGNLQVGSGGTVGTLGTGTVFGDSTVKKVVFKRSDDISVANDFQGPIEIRQEGAGQLTLSGQISGAVNVVQQSAGSTFLTGSNSYSGTTTVGLGTLKLGNASAIGSGAVSVYGTLDMNGNNTIISSLTGDGSVTSNVSGAVELTVGDATHFTFSGVVSDGLGTVSLTKQGTGQLWAYGVNTYTGGTKILNGSVYVSTALGSGRLGTGDILNNGLIVFRSTNTTTINDVISGSGSIRQTGGTVIFAADNTYSGTTTIGSSATLQVGNGGSTGSLGAGEILSESTNLATTVVFNKSSSSVVSNDFVRVWVIQQGTGDLDLTGDISGESAVFQRGAGEMKLSGNNSYTGITTVNASRTLKVSHSNAIGSGIVTVNGTLDLNGNSSVLNSLNGSGTITSSVPGSAVVVTGFDNLASSFSGVIQNGGGLVSIEKRGSARFTLRGNNTFSGGVNIADGTLSFINTASIGTGPIVNNAVLMHEGSGTSTVSAAITGTGALLQSVGTLVLTGSNTYTGETRLAGLATLVVGNGGTSGTLGSGEVKSTSASSTSYLNFNRSDSITVDNKILGAIRVRQQGAGELQLTGNNEYVGGTSIDASRILKAGNDAAVGGGDVTLNGTLDLAGFNVVLGKLTGAGVVSSSLTDGKLIVGSFVSQPFTFSGVIQDGTGTVSVVKRGDAVFTLAGNHSYSGDTTIEAGKLAVGSNTAIPTGVDKGNLIVLGTIDLNGYSVTANGLSGSGTITSNKTGTVTLTLGNADTSSVFPGTIQNGTGIVKITKVGSGELTLSGINTHTGDTTISAGALSFDLHSLGSGGVVFNGGTLRWMEGNSEDVSSQISPIASGKTAFIDTNGNEVILASAISGAGGLTKIGLGKLSLEGANTYTGITSVTQGSLSAEDIDVNSGSSNLGNAASAIILGDSSSDGKLIYTGPSSTFTRGITVNSGGGQVEVSNAAETLTIATGSLSTSGSFLLGGIGNLEISSAITGTGSLTKVGTGTLTLSGSNSYTGITHIVQGIVIASSITTGGSSSFGNSSSPIELGDATLQGALSYSGPSATFTRGIVVNAGGGQLSVFNPLTNLTVSTVDINTVGRFVVGGSGNATILSDIDGAGALVKEGVGTLQLSGSNTYDGNTEIVDGVLSINGTNALPNGLGKGVLVVDGTLDLNGFSPTVNGLEGSGIVTSGLAGSAIFTVGENDQNSVFNGTVQDGAGIISVVKTGIGSVTLTGTNTYSGSTKISEGELEFDAGGLGVGTIVFDGGSLVWTEGNTEDVSTRFSAISTGLDAIIDTKGNNLTLSGSIAGSGGVSKVGLGTLVLAGANSYTGGTTVLNGQLQFNAGAVPTLGVIEIEDEGILNANGQYNSVSAWLASGKISATSTGTLAFTANETSPVSMTGYPGLYLGATTDVTMSGVITPTGGGYRLGGGTGTLTVTSALPNSVGTDYLSIRGGVAVSGVNTFTGGTEIHKGSLAIEDSSAIGGSGSSIAFSGGLLRVIGSTLQNLNSHIVNWSSFNGGFDIADAGNTFTVNQNLSGAGGFTKSGAGKLVLSGGNTYNGDTIIESGTLKIENSNAIPSGVGKGNLIVNGVLDLNGIDLTLNGLEGSGAITSSQSGTVVLSVGGNNRTSDFGGAIGDGDGKVELVKLGSGTLTLSGNSTYSGVTDVQGGILELNGNLNSHVTDHGGTVAGWFFRDPDIAVAVRKTLGIAPNSPITQNDLLSLYSLTLDSNIISDLKGLENATNLYTLTLQPGDYSVPGSLEDSQFSASLEWLNSLDNLESLTLQKVGLTDEKLEALTGLESLKVLDVRYNSLAVIPTSTVDLPSLSSLLVYGNTAITNTPRVGLQNLAGALVSIDIPADHPDQATSIEDLAAAFYHLPIDLYEYVVNTVEFEPYAGAKKGPLAALQTRSANAWDTTSLLAALLLETGVIEETLDLRTQDYRYTSGRVHLPIETAMKYFGVSAPEAANQIAETAGLNPDLILDGSSEIVAIVFDHTWLDAKLGGGEWKSLDASWKFQQIRNLGRDILDSVGWETNVTTNEYFAQVRSDLPSEYYESEVREYLATNEPWLSIADLSYTGPIVTQTINSLPDSLPYALWDGIQTWDSQSNDPAPVETYSSVPNLMNHRLRVILHASVGDGQYFDSGLINIPEESLSSIQIRPTHDVGTWVRPELVINGESVVKSKYPFAPNDSLKITIEYYKPNDTNTPFRSATVGATNFETFYIAGNYYSVQLDAGQTSQHLIKEQRRIANEAAIAYMDGEELDMEASIGGFLHLAGLEYNYQLNEATDAINGITAARSDSSTVSFGLVTAAAKSGALHQPGTSNALKLQSLSPELASNLHNPVLPEKYAFDLIGSYLKSVSINGEDANALERHQIIHHTNSALEHSVFEGLTNADGMSTIKSLQLARQAGTPIVEIPPYSSHSTINSLLSLGVSGSGIVSGIATLSSQGMRVWVPKIRTNLNDWTELGYLVDDSNGFTQGYYISGGLNGGVNTGKPNDPGQPPNGNPNSQASEGDPVVVSTGTLFYDHVDFSFPGVGFNLSFARHFQSDQTGSLIYSSDRGMGDGWSYSYSDRLETSLDSSFPSGSKVWFTDSGERRVFVPNGTGGYETPESYFGSLVNNGTGFGFTWTDSYGNVVHFSDADGSGISRLESKADRYGNGIEVEYDVNGRPDLVSDAVNPTRWIDFTYTGDKITSVEDFTGRTWNYGYVEGRLSSATAPSDLNTQQGVIEYEYYSNTSLDGLLKKVTTENGNETEFSYYPNRWAFEVTFSEGDVQTFVYNPHKKQTDYIDERNLTTRHTFNSDGNTVVESYADRTNRMFEWVDNMKVSSTDSLGQTEFYEYDADGNLVSLTDRLGQVTTYAYTDYSNPSSVTKHNGGGTADDQVTVFSYILDSFSKDDKLQEVTDAEGNVTRYTYNNADGLRGLPDTITRPRGTATTGDPDDFVTEYTYNEAGQVTQKTTRASIGNPITESFSYDSRGWVLTSTNANGQVSTTDYDLVGRPIKLTLPDPDGVGGNVAPTTSFSYDLRGNLTETTVTTPGASKTSNFTYDSFGRQIRMENADGTYRTKQYDMLSNIISETDELGRVTRFIYDDRNRVSAIILPDGNVVATSYDGGGRIVATSDVMGSTTLFSYDALGRLIKTTNTKGGEVERAYDESGNLYSVTDELGRSTIYFYDLLGRVTTVTQADPDGAGPKLSPVTQFYYDENGNLSAETDALGRTTVYVYDEVDRKTMLIEPDPDGAGPLATPVTHFGYDNVGNLTSVTDPLGNVTTRNYDALNRLITLTEADPDYGGPLTSPVTSYEYDAFGNLASVIDPMGRETGYEYDIKNRVVRVTQPAPYGSLYSESPTTEYSFDAVGNRLSVTDPFGIVVRYAYNDLNAPTSVSTIDGGVSRSEYDANGNLVRTIDPLQRATVYSYDELNRLVSATDPREETTYYSYDAVGNRTSVTDPNGNVTEYIHDNLSRVIERIDPLEKSTFYEFDSVGNLIETTDREGRVRTIAYDNLNQPISETWHDGMTTVNTLSFSYDLVGNMLTASDDFSSYEFTYDNLHRLLQSDNAGTPGAPNVILSYAYDAVGNVISTNDDTGVSVASIFDGLNRLNRRSWSGGGIYEARVDISYNARSERTSATRYSDVAGTQQVGRSSYTSDALGRTNSITHLNALDSVLARYDYGYDLASQLAEWSHHGETINFAHDNAGQLTSANYITQTDESYTYDANGNRIGGGMVVGDNNQILSDGTFDYTYDDEGNLSRKTDIASSNYVEYKYDLRNRMVSAIDYSASDVVLQAVEFTYDLFDRRIAKSVDVDGAGPTGAVTVHTVYDGEHAWADFDASEDVLARYLFGDRTDEIVARWSPTDGTAWYLTDHLGTVRDIVDDTGTLINTITYDSFGGIVVQTNAAAGDRFTYTGREFDSETGLYYYRARYYDAHLGRFISQDPISFAAGDANLYRYVANQPMIYVDPFGLQSWSSWFATDVIGTLREFPKAYFETAASGEQIRSLAATIDGFVPFADPFAQAGAYDVNEGVNSTSQVVGQITRDAMIIASTSGASAWFQTFRNPFLYELGATTVPYNVWRAMEGMNVLQRGAYLWSNYGWKGFTLGSQAVGEFVKTVPQGLTPSAALALLGILKGLDALGSYLFPLGPSPNGSQSSQTPGGTASEESIKC